MYQNLNKKCEICWQDIAQENDLKSINGGNNKENAELSGASHIVREFLVELQKRLKL